MPEPRETLWGGGAGRVVPALLLALFVLLGVPVVAQDPTPRPAVLTVIYGGVDLRRAHTDAWLPLTPGAVMPSGSGDSLRTDDTGRALLTFPDAEGDILLLPNTVFTLAAYTGGPALAGALEAGEVVGRVARADTATVDGGPLGVVALDVFPAHFALSRAGGAAVLVVWRGEVTTGGAARLVAQQARYADAASTFNADAPEPHPAPASVIGLADGCPATITTRDGLDLNARTGPSTSDLQLGQFPDGAQVRVMGVVAAGGWVRVQFRSGFGWVERLAVTLDDPDCVLPTLPDTSFDLPTIIFGPTARELDLLAPFYGDRRYDPIFYRPLPPA